MLELPPARRRSRTGPAVSVHHLADLFAAARRGKMVEEWLAIDAQDGRRSTSARLVCQVAVVVKRGLDLVERRRAHGCHLVMPAGLTKCSHPRVHSERNRKAGGECPAAELLSLGKGRAGRWGKSERECPESVLNLTADECRPVVRPCTVVRTMQSRRRGVGQSLTPARSTGPAAGRSPPWHLSHAASVARLGRGLRFYRTALRRIWRARSANSRTRRTRSSERPSPLRREKRIPSASAASFATLSCFL